MDENLHFIINKIHVIVGAIAFVAAPVAIVVNKGQEAHKIAGKIFFWCMTVSCATAFWVSVSSENIFFILLSIFSYYSIFYAYRILYLKKLHRDQKPIFIDWLAIAITGIACTAFVGLGLKHMINGNFNLFVILSVLFGGLGLFNIYGNSKIFFVKPEKGNYWLPNHIGNMLGGYIAALTAFSANVLAEKILTSAVAWLWPSAIGVPLIFYFTGRFKGGKLKFSEKR